MLFRCCRLHLFCMAGYLAVALLFSLEECEAFVLRPTTTTTSNNGASRLLLLPVVDVPFISAASTTSLYANNNNNNNSDFTSNINIGQVLQTATFAFGLGFLALTFILPEFGYDFVVQDNGRLGIGTVQEAQFQRETLKAEKEAKAKAQQLVLQSSES